MSDPVVTDGSNNIVTDLQSQTIGSGYLEFYEVEIPGSNIGGSNVDKLYFHPGSDGTFSDLTWYSLINEQDFGSTDSSKYTAIAYSALPIQAEGFEVRGTGTLPRPTITMANINQYWTTYLTNYDDLIGAKVIRRRTLEKYLNVNPPVEFPRDVYYVERKVKESADIVEFELASAFDVEGIQLPRRVLVAAKCAWKYKDTDQGGCDWPVDSIFNGDKIYFTKEDVRIPEADEHNITSASSAYWIYWGQQGVSQSAVRKATAYGNLTFKVGDFVEYQRGVGLLTTVSSVETTTNTATFDVRTSAAAAEFEVGDYLVTKGMGIYAYKEVPLYVSAVSGTNVTVEAPQSLVGTGSYTANTGYIQNTRNTLYRCITAHSISTSDTIDDLIRPTNITYWELGDVCGKRLTSCKKRFGFLGTATSNAIETNGILGVFPVFLEIANGTLPEGDSVLGRDPNETPVNVEGEIINPGFIEPQPQVGSGYTTATVSISSNTGAGAVINANIVSGSIQSYTVVQSGSSYKITDEVIITGDGSGALARLSVSGQGTDAVIREVFDRNAELPFGGFPGAVLY